MISACFGCLGGTAAAGQRCQLSRRHCGVGAVDPGSAGSPGAGAPVDPPRAVDATHQPISDSGGAEGSSSPGSSDGGAPAVAAPACTEEPMNPQPAAGSPWWDGQSAADGAGRAVGVHRGNDARDLHELHCADAAFRGQWCTSTRGPGWCSCSRSTAASDAGGTGAAGVSASCRSLNRQCISGRTTARSRRSTGCIMWVDDPGVVTATATAGAVSVTATARLTSVTWSMGEPALGGRTLPAAAAPDHLSGAGYESGTGGGHDR